MSEPLSPEAVPCRRSLPHLPHDEHTGSEYPCPGVPLSPERAAEAAAIWAERDRRIAARWPETTSIPLSPERLAEYAALEQAATEGPWEADDWEINSPGGCWVGETCDVDDSQKSRADAAFIAAARTAVPELLAEVDRVRAERDALAHELEGASLARWEDEQQVAEKVRSEIAADLHRADVPTFAETEDPVLVVKTTRAIDVRLVSNGPDAPYYVAPKAGDQR